MNRRDFLKVSTISASVIALDMATPDTVFAKNPLNNLDIVRTAGFSIMQGLTTYDSTQLSIDVPKDMKVHYQLMDASSGRLFLPVYQKSASRSKSKWRVDKVGYSNLPVLGRFVFRVIDDKGAVLDERNLSLLDLSKRNPRLGLMSCMDEDSKNIDAIWSQVEKSNCDMFFFFGDHVYGDTALIFDSPDMLWDKYLLTRQLVPYYHWKNLKPALVVWDDHDYGRNNADGKYKHKNDSMVTFRAFTAQEAIAGNFEAGPGVSSFFRAFGQKFILLDNRWFKNISYDGIKGFLGKEQIDWAISKLSQGNEPNWIIEGSQFFQTGKECFLTQARPECEIFTKKVGQLNSPSLFVAGDVHYTEISKAPKNLLGYDTIEITSSCLHSTPKKKPPKNPARLQSAVQENFVVVDILPTQFDLSFDLQSIGLRNVNFKDTYNIG